MTGLSLLSQSETSNPLHDDACIHGYPLFPSGGLLRVRTGQLSEGDGRAGVNLPPAAFRAGGPYYGNLSISAIMNTTLLWKVFF